MGVWDDEADTRLNRTTYLHCVQSSTIHATKAFYGAFKIWGFWVPGVKSK